RVGRVVVDEPPAAQLDRPELDLQGPGLDDLREHRDLGERRPAAGLHRKVDVVEPDRAQNEPAPPETREPQIDLEPGQLDEVGAWLAWPRGDGDVADDHATEPGLHGNALDGSRTLERRGERHFQALAGELRAPDAHYEPRAECQDERQNKPGARGIAEVAPEPSTPRRTLAHGALSIPTAQ